MEELIWVNNQDIDYIRCVTYIIKKDMQKKPKSYVKDEEKSKLEAVINNESKYIEKMIRFLLGSTDERIVKKQYQSNGRINYRFDELDLRFWRNGIEYIGEIKMIHGLKDIDEMTEEKLIRKLKDCKNKITTKLKPYIGILSSCAFIVSYDNLFKRCDNVHDFKIWEKDTKGANMINFINYSDLVKLYNNEKNIFKIM